MDVSFCGDSAIKDFEMVSFRLIPSALCLDVGSFFPDFGIEQTSRRESECFERKLSKMLKPHSRGRAQLKKMNA